MKTSHKFGLILGSSVALATGLSWWKGRRGTELAFDGAVYGGMTGLALGCTAAWFTGESSTALTNSSEGIKGFGKLNPNVVKMLSEINAEDLYAPVKQDGIKVAVPPANAHHVAQEDF